LRRQSLHQSCFSEMKVIATALTGATILRVPSQGRSAIFGRRAVDKRMTVLNRLDRLHRR